MESKIKKIPRKKERVVLIDGRNLLYRAYWSHKGLAYKGKSTAAIYGFPSILKSILFRLKPKKVFVVWDGKKSTYRMKLLPDYKKRDKPRLGFDFEDFERQEKMVKTMLQTLGISQVYHKKMEADDLIYGLCERYKSQKKVYIVSSDKDFDQLIGPNVVVWNDKDNKIINLKTCKKYKGYEPHQCVDFLCLTGDKSDNIPGYKGIGDKGALKFLNEHLSIAHFLENPKKPTHKGIDRNVLEKLYALNLRVIDLRVHWEQYTPSLELKDCFIKPNYSIESFKELALNHGMKSLIKRAFLKEFKTQFYRSHKKKVLVKGKPKEKIKL